MTLYIVNYSPTTVQQSWYQFKSTAIASTTYPSSNWTCITSSTGSGGVYAQLGDVITSASSLGNLSWFVLKGKGTMDSGVIYYRELCFQFNTAGDCRITYSPSMGFVAGSPSTTQVPSALDGEILYGGGTDASPTFTALLPGGGVWMQGAFSETDDAFFVLTYAVGGAYPNSMFYLETTPLVYTIGGALIDKDPCVLYCSTGTNSATKTNIGSEVRGPFGLLSLDVTVSTLWCRLAGAFRAVVDSAEAYQVTIPGSMTSPPSPYLTSPTYRQETIAYGRRTTLSGTVQSGNVGNANTVGFKGEGNYIRWAGTTFVIPQLVNLVDLGTGGTQSGVVLAVGDLFLPWGVGVAPSL
jgi:hypothetical protein